MACNPPIMPKSKPYWNGLRMTTPQARKSFEWLRHESPLLASVIVVDLAKSKDHAHANSIDTWVPYTLSGDHCPGWLIVLGFNPSAEQHAKVICCMTPQVEMFRWPMERGALGDLSNLDVGKDAWA
jgi:hypothetical protein